MLLPGAPMRHRTVRPCPDRFDHGMLRLLPRPFPPHRQPILAGVGFMSLLAIPRSLVLGAILVTTASFGCGDGTRVTSPSSRQDGLRQVTTVEPSRLVSCTVSWAAAVS